MYTVVKLLILAMVCQANERLSGSGRNYRGKQTRTTGGWECQPWHMQAPHPHKRTTARYRDAGLDSNYCRNPDGHNTIWCYTMNHKIRWQYCMPLGINPEPKTNEES